MSVCVKKKFTDGRIGIWQQDGENSEWALEPNIWFLCRTSLDQLCSRRELAKCL